MKLTEELIAQASDGAPPSSIAKLALPNKELEEISGLGVLINLVRLDLSDNRLQSIKALSNCRNLKWLSVGSNDLESLEGVQALSNLMVLNCSCNKLTSIREVEGLIGLRAMIANDNEIKTICNLQKLTALNTLVLSKNPISSFGVALECVSSLNKLSLSNCKLQELFSLKELVELKELRLAQNNIKSLSKDLAKNIKLRIVDLGSNSLKDLTDLEILSTLPFLRNLNVRGNPLCLQANYQEKLKALLPALKVLDGHNLRNSTKWQSNNQSILSNATKQLEGVELAGLNTSHTIKETVKAGKDQLAQTSEHTSDRVKQPEKCQKAEKVLRKEPLGAIGIQEDRTFKDRKERLKKPENHQKHEEASKDKNKNMQETIQNNIIRKRSWHSASDNNDSEPFLEYIGQNKPNTDASKQPPGHVRQKEESGIVSILDKPSKAAKQKKHKHTAQATAAFSISMGEVEVGGGGQSSWE